MYAQVPGIIIDLPLRILLYFCLPSGAGQLAGAPFFIG